MSTETSLLWRWKGRILPSLCFWWVGAAPGLVSTSLQSLPFLSHDILSLSLQICHPLSGHQSLDVGPTQIQHSFLNLIISAKPFLLKSHIHKYQVLSPEHICLVCIPLRLFLQWRVQLYASSHLIYMFIFPLRISSDIILFLNLSHFSAGNILVFRSHGVLCYTSIIRKNNSVLLFSFHCMSYFTLNAVIH
jgi:hypothetical protein